MTHRWRMIVLGAGPVGLPGVQIPPPPPPASLPGVQIPWVAETPRRPEAVVILGPYRARIAWSGRLSSRTSPGLSGLGATWMIPMSTRPERIAELAWRSSR